MRWKAHFYLNGIADNPQKMPSFGLKSKRNLPPVPELKPFEEDVARMLENIQFRCVNDQFMAPLENDILKVKSSPNVFIFADKTATFMKPTHTRIINC